MVRRFLALGFAGALLGLAEALLVGVLDRSLFLSVTEWHRYAWAALLNAFLLTSLCGALVGMCLRVQALRRRPQVAIAVVSGPLLFWALSLLTEGRRVRDLPFRWVLVLSLASAGAALIALLIKGLVPRLRAGPSRTRWAAAVLLVAALCLAIDSQVLRRLYPAFHVALSIAAVFLSALASLGLQPLVGRFERRRPWALWVAGLVAPFWIGSVFAAPNLRFVVRDASPLLGKVMAVARAAEAQVADPVREAAPAPVTVMTSAGGIDLRGRDVLLITVDALRADRLKAYGGKGLTPHMDALAEQGAVFQRAYTTTPHTSYAMSSLMTGKYMREVLALSEAEGEHATLAETVRRYGYRTAGFYPPALFFVDASRFVGLRDKHFGFEYAKAMFAPAAERVTQVADYLDRVEPGHPILLWVHMFEPHEPYDPPPAFARGDSPEERYDGEVAATDDAVGELVNLVRKRRGAGVVVVLTADHGEEFMDHGGQRHGTTLFDEQVRVPLVFVADGAITPRRIDDPTDNTDVTTTLLGALGMPREARMRGDDLSDLLADRPLQQPIAAFASVGDEQMVVQAGHKLICASGRDCRLFDLDSDPQERVNLVDRRPREVFSLRAALSGFAASISRGELLDLHGSVFPEVLSRARLGDPSSASELLPLLSDARPPVRAAAALALGELGHAEARQALAGLRQGDPDEAVRTAAALAALQLGDEQALDSVVATVTAANGDPDLRRKAAFVLAERGRAEAVSVLIGVAGDEAAEESERVLALQYLGKFAQPESEAALTAALSEVRLREAAAAGLGQMGTASAERTLARALEGERYPEARAAEAHALSRLGHRGLGKQLVRFLGTDSGVPGGVSLLFSLPPAERVGVTGGLLSNLSSQRLGSWQCLDDACEPGPQAAVRLTGLRRGPRPARLLLSISAGPQAHLTLGGERFDLSEGEGQLSFQLSPKASSRLAVEGQRVRVRHVAVIPVTEDIAPPPPEPWDGGTQDSL